MDAVDAVAPIYRLTLSWSHKDVLPFVLQFECPRKALKECQQAQRMGLAVVTLEEVVGEAASRISIAQLRGYVRARLKVK